MTEIIKGLYLCSWEDAKRIVPTLRNLLVINCTKDLDNLIDNVYRINIDDRQNPEDTLELNNVINEVVDLIDNHLKTGNVVVHCLAGRQRSAAVVASYLIKFHGKSVNESIDFVKSKKRDAFFPFINFMDTINRNLVMA